MESILEQNADADGMPRQVLYDWRFPLVLRILGPLIGIFFLYNAADVVGDAFFGLDLGMGIKHEPDTLIRVLLALVGTPFIVLIGAMFIWIWFARLRILYDSQNREVIRETRSYFRAHEQRSPLTDVKMIHAYYVPGSGFARHTQSGIALELADGHIQSRIWIDTSQQKVNSIAAALGAAAKLPVRKQGEN